MTYLSKAIANFNRDQYQQMNSEMSFSEYLDLCYQKPQLLRNSWQTIYEMILEKGCYPIEEYRKTYIHYNFFDDQEIPIVGLASMKDALVKFIKGAAGGYGTERRILLLHGPVGSSKSTICRLLKRGMERYSRTDAGAWYSFKWVNLPTGSEGIYTDTECFCPMHEQPLKLLPLEVRKPIMDDLNRIFEEQATEERRSDLYTLKCNDDLDPLCKKFMNALLKKYDGDLEKVLENHIRVVRKVYSEADRCGIATFQPKDEKNQDSTELTGDINFRQIGNFGSDSDPRAFSFDGEFCVGNRGLIEFIEVLKLDTAFLYDLLGASQEQSIKPKKFSQVSIDEAVIGHSVHSETPIPHLYDGKLDVLPISALAELEVGRLQVFSVNEETGEVELTPVRNVFSHPYEGDWIVNRQDGEELVTTPNHSVYNNNLELFMPGNDQESEIYRIEFPLDIILNYPKTERWNSFYTKQSEA
jgi:serine protein kinase